MLTIVGGKAVYAAEEFAELCSAASAGVCRIGPRWRRMAATAKPALAPASARCI